MELFPLHFDISIAQVIHKKRYSKLGGTGYKHVERGFVCILDELKPIGNGHKGPSISRFFILGERNM